MPPSQRIPPLSQNTSISPRSSAAPLLPADQQEPEQFSESGVGDEGAKDIDPKTGKRRLFGLGRKRDEKEAQRMDAPAVGGMLPSTQAAVNAMEPLQDPKPHTQLTPLSPTRLPNLAASAASPSRLRSSSPRLHSPASSEIFERNVQEPVPLSTLQGELSPAHIATHVTTEDHIPAALDASTQAITSEELNPDEVEIVTSSSHQPAAEKVLEASASHADLTSLQSPTLKHHASDASEIAASIHALQAAADNEGATNYGHLDPNDVRRLSFISFADVVQSEHDQQAASSLGDLGSRESLHMGSLPGSLPSVHERAASPLRSPVGSLSRGVTTPPPPGVSIESVQDQSPSRSQSGGLATSPPSGAQHGELTIETMRQAVRKTASGDLSGVRSAGMSPVADENSMREARSRTNT